MSTPDETQAATGAERLLTAIRQHSLRLGAFALGAALLLALVFYGTAERIALQRQQAERAALAAVMPAITHDNDLLNDSFLLDPAASTYTDIELLGLSTARPAYLARQGSTVTGVILPLETAEGYSGTITLLIGITTQGVITGLRVLDHRETPGLGDKIEPRISPWILGFDNRSLDNTAAVLWQVKKDGGDFDQFVGATITPRAVVGAAYQALQFFESNRATLLQEPAR
jgi:electron transport complex protein RnfG